MNHAIRSRAAYLVLAVFVMTACGTSKSSYQTFAAVKTGVDVGMSAWADRVVAGKTTPQQQAQVKAAFEAYQTAYVAAINHAVSGSSSPAPAEVIAAAANITNLLVSFGVQTK
jgi:hypothetical protein